MKSVTTLLLLFLISCSSYQTFDRVMQDSDGTKTICGVNFCTKLQMNPETGKIIVTDKTNPAAPVQDLELTAYCNEPRSKSNHTVQLMKMDPSRDAAYWIFAPVVEMSKCSFTLMVSKGKIDEIFKY